ncbi:MAG: hypothetical protein M3Z75_17515 [Actinomycetota bacterium]|nr:hypothetical protein [Actinomycetota bacterium]
MPVAVVSELEDRICDALGPERAEQLRDLLEVVISLLGPGTGEHRAASFGRMRSGLPES